LRKQLKGGSSRHYGAGGEPCGVSSKQMRTYLQGLELADLLRYAKFGEGKMILTLASQFKNPQALSIKPRESHEKGCAPANMEPCLTGLEQRPSTLEFSKEYVPSKKELSQYKQDLLNRKIITHDLVQNLIDRELKSRECKQQSLKSARSAAQRKKRRTAAQQAMRLGVILEDKELQ